MKLYVRHVEQTNKELNETMKVRRGQVFQEVERTD